MKLWLKGGLIGLLLAILLSIYILTATYCIGLNSDGTSNCPTKFNLFLDNLTTLYPWIILTLILFFVIGAFIGWIIEIIKKNRNNK